jgi:hypothetical protein
LVLSPLSIRSKELDGITANVAGVGEFDQCQSLGVGEDGREVPKVRHAALSISHPSYFDSLLTLMIDLNYTGRPRALSNFLLSIVTEKW